VPTASRLDCSTCGTTSSWSEVRRATVPSSERDFEHERFTVWSCPACGCIHALDEVELDRYYQDYGLHRITLGAMERLCYRNQLRFLRRHARLGPSDPVLDFGCGSGMFVEFLRRRGWTKVAGYDPYSARYRDPSVLERRYHLVLSTDVIDQVPSPVDHLATVCPMVAKGGFLYLQVADARQVDLAHPQAIRQVLHQPYRRHLVSTDWLAEAVGGHGFRAVAQTHRPYFHTRIPFLNLPTIDDYLERHGGLVALNEPFRWSSLRRPGFWYRGLTGGFVSRTDEAQLIFQHPG
jgi:SAM-dependent methyltransferase